MRKYDVQISDTEFGQRIGILFSCEQNGKTAYAEPVELVFKEMGNEGEIIRPTITLDRFAANEMLKALANALQKVGVHPDTESQIKGELSATKYHLEDMRAILNLEGTGRSKGEK